MFSLNIITNNVLNNNAKKYLLERGIDEKTALDLGFFSVSKVEGKKLIGKSLSGLGITYFNINKKVTDYRLRPFESDWDSAPLLKENTLKRKGELPKFLSRPKARPFFDKENEIYKFPEAEEQRINKAYFSPCLDWLNIQKKSSIDILITEGEAKATLACLHGIPTIGLPGVYGYTNDIVSVEGINKEFLPDLEWITPSDETRDTYWVNRNVGLVFDSDIVGKHQVQSALIGLANKLNEFGAKPFLILLPTEANGKKNGLDDFIVRHGIDAFKKLVQQFKILHQSEGRLLISGKDSYGIGKLEPIASIKGLMTWSCLKDNLAYREGYGWYEWRGKFWKLINESQVLNSIQSFRYANQWLQISDEICLKELRSGIANHEIEWNPRNVLGFENGYLNTDTNKLIAHDKSHYLTSILPFDYNLKAQCPQWLKFLYDTFDGDQDKIEYLKAWFKWILFPEKAENYPIEATLWMIGEPQTGKGTTLSILRALVGKENIGGFEPRLMENPNHLFGMIDKKLSLNTDVTGFIANVGIYNKICSNEPVTVKNLYHNQFQTCLNTVTVFAMNKPVGFPSGGSEGLSRRLHVLNFDKKATVKDPDLKQKLASEIEGIFAWCWGLTFPQVKSILNWRVTDAVKEIYQGQVTEILFFQEQYPDGKDFIKASDLYSEFAEWAKLNGYNAVNSQNFYLALKKIKTIIKTITRNGTYYEIPSMEKYADPEFSNTIFKPTDVISNLDDTVIGSCKGGIYAGDYCDGFCPDTDSLAVGSVGFSSKVSEESEKNNSNFESSIEKPTTPPTPIDIYSQNPSQTSQHTPNTHHSQSQQPIEPKVQNNQDDLSKYESFQKVGKLNSCDIREARNRSHKIKNDILASSNNEELKLVREEFGYLPSEIEWVWTHLLTKQEKAQIKQLTKQTQTELTLKNSNENIEQTLICPSDFKEILRQNTEVLTSVFNISDKLDRLRWYQSFFAVNLVTIKDLLNPEIITDEMMIEAWHHLQTKMINHKLRN